MNDKISSSQIRFFLGYTGWGENQLQEEINEKSWFLSANNYANILEEDIKNLWKQELLKKGGDYKLWANAPSNIQLN